MAAATLYLEESSPRRGWLTQLAVTLFLGIPLTLALTIGLVFYCLYECLKFAISSRQTAHSEEHKFTSSLTKLARIHPPSPAITNPAPAEPAQTQTAANSDSPR